MAKMAKPLFALADVSKKVIDLKLTKRISAKIGDIVDDNVSQQY